MGSSTVMVVLLTVVVVPSTCRGPFMTTLPVPSGDNVISPLDELTIW